MQFGLIGRNLSHSFSAAYFEKKFLSCGLHHYTYRIFDLENIGKLPELIDRTPDLMGLNVTIPYKSDVLSYVNSIDEATQAIGAANTLKIVREKDKTIIKAFNTDHLGFSDSLKQQLQGLHTHALILGTGGAARAVAYALGKHHMNYFFVSRSKKGNGVISYHDIDKGMMGKHTLIINATPSGMFPNLENSPEIPYKYLTHRHFLYDLIYNPALTEFLKKGQQQNAYICNGLNMLYAQAEYSWNIWQDENL